MHEGVTNELTFAFIYYINSMFWKAQPKAIVSADGSILLNNITIELVASEIH